MKNVFNVVLVCAGIGAASVSFADNANLQTNAPYLGVQGGLLFGEDTETGFRGGFQAGYRLGNWRLEGEYAYSSHPVDVYAYDYSQITVTDDYWMLMANAYYDFHLSPRASLFFGLGFGTLQNTVPYEESFFAYQTMLGFGYEFTPHFEMRAALNPVFISDYEGAFDYNIGVQLNYIF